jgi:hypothetical protein
MIAPLQTDVFTTVRTFLLSLFPTVEVIHGLGNGTPTPLNGFIAFTPLFMSRVNTNENSFQDPTPTTGTKKSAAGIQYTFQIDCYGNDSANWAAEISTMWRDEYACTIMGNTCQPLYADEPKMMPLISGEQNYVQRWTITAELQYNPITTTPMEFFDAQGTTTLNPN